MLKTLFSSLARSALPVAAFAVMLVGLQTAPALAQFKTKATHAILLDANTGAVLFEKNSSELMPPASMSKLMTLAVIFRALKEGEAKLDEPYLVSEHAWRTGGGPSGTSAMFVDVNSQVKLSELLQGIIIQSGNDACITVAEGMAGSEEAFAERMNEEARRIGLKRSTFANSTGLPHPDHLMTARDLAKLALFLMKQYPDYYRYFSQKQYRYKKYRFNNRNPLLYLDIGVDGLKTGYTKEAGYGLVASARRGKRRLVMVISGLKTKRERKAEGRKLLEWGFRGFKEYKIFDSGEEIESARVWGGSRFFVPLVGNGPVHVFLPRYAKKRSVKARVIYKGPLKPPIRRGDRVATLRVEAAGAGVNNIPLYAAVDVGRGGLIRRGLDSLLHLAFGWIL